jgi:ribonucleoside-diphosphate reductase subunit M2
MLDASILTRKQVAAAIDTLKMTDSPAKKLDFSTGNKENVFRPIVGIPDITTEDDASGALSSTAPTIKPEEADEPLLRENPQRFVMFPIKYHDVSVIHVFDASLDTLDHRSKTPH